MRSLRYYLPFALAVLIGLCFVYSTTDVWPEVLRAWPAAVTMVFGSFIAGASAEGGGAIAFPVFTLLLKINPPSARNFSFAIQSFGMVSATLLILGRGIVIERRAILYASIGGIAGLVLGTYWVAPYLQPATTKIAFVSLWMAFGVGLWRANRNKTRIVAQSLPQSIGTADIQRLLLVGFGGGIVTSIFGNGIDLVTFCVLTLWYRIDERIATPTSVVLMSILTVSGFALHSVVIGDFGPVEYHAWLAAAPVAIVFAPLGAYVISRWTRLAIARLLYAIMVVQLIGALYVLGFTLQNILLSSVIIIAGSWLMIRIDTLASQRAPQHLSVKPGTGPMD